MPFAKRYWKIGETRLPDLPLQLGERVGLGERARERLLDDDVAAGEQRLARLREVQRRGRADVDDVEIELEQRVEVGDDVGMPYSSATFSARSASMSQSASTE